MWVEYLPLLFVHRQLQCVLPSTTFLFLCRCLTSSPAWLEPAVTPLQIRTMQHIYSSYRFSSVSFSRFCLSFVVWTFPIVRDSDVALSSRAVVKWWNPYYHLSGGVDARGTCLPFCFTFISSRLEFMNNQCAFTFCELISKFLKGFWRSAIKFFD